MPTLELCKELFELSGWDGIDHVVYRMEKGKPIATNAFDDRAVGTIPTYTLDYLLRKLPKSVKEFWGRAYPASPCLMYSGTQWVMFYKSEMTGEHNTDELFTQFADTPEDAACMLAIELFQQGILRRE